jgi:hypothetical protein
MMGRTVVGSVGPDVIVGVRFAKTENDRIRKLTTGDKLQIKARVVDWDDLDKRLIMEAI